MLFNHAKLKKFSISYGPEIKHLYTVCTQYTAAHVYAVHSCVLCTHANVYQPVFSRSTQFSNRAREGVKIKF